MSDVEIINGKKYKKCKDGKIRNLKTMRCINIKNKPIKNKSVNKSKSNKFFHDLLIHKLMPIINIKTGNVNDRLRYYFLIKKFLNLSVNVDKCIKIYKLIDNKPVFRIGNNIILKNRIGSDSAYGIVYLSAIRDKKNNIPYKYVTKICKQTKNATTDYDIQQELMKNITNCPHYPILYGNLNCTYEIEKNNGYYVIKKSNEFSKTNPNSKSKTNNLFLYPKLIRESALYKLPLLITFNELANGDLSMYLLNMLNKITINEQIFNTIPQIFLAILFYQHDTNFTHNDCHWGNFLFHNIKPGGYFHYKISGDDYYLKNIGILWIIWDFELSRLEHKSLQFNDFYRIIHAFLPKNINKKYEKIHKDNYDFSVYKGWNTNKLFLNNNELILKLQKFMNIFKNDIYDNKYKLDYNINKKNIIKLLVKFNMLLTDIPNKSLIINKTPYILNHF